MGLKDPLLLGKCIQDSFAQAKDRATMAPSDASDSRDGTLFPPTMHSLMNITLFEMKFDDIYSKRINENHKNDSPGALVQNSVEFYKRRMPRHFSSTARFPKPLDSIQSCYYDVLQQAPLVGALQVWHSTHSCPGGLSSLCLDCSCCGCLAE